MQLGGVWKSVLWFVLGLLVAGAVISLFVFPRGEDRTVAIRTYDVNPEIAGELRSALNAAFWMGKDTRPLGQVTLSPSGQLIVTGSESVQDGVRRVIAEVSERKLARTPSMLFEAWIVTAAPAGTPGGSDSVPATDPRLAEVGPALEAIQKARGPRRFELVEKLATQARSGNEDSEVRGSRASMRVTPTIRLGDNDQPVVSAMFRIQAHWRMTDQPGTPPREIKSMAELKPGELLVVGQSSAGGGSGNSPDSDVYYIVRASL